jgi:hypothetical protein
VFDSAQHSIDYDGGRISPEVFDSGDFNRFIYDEVVSLMKGGGPGRVRQ